MPEYSIHAGTVDDIRPDSGEWLVIDLGFAQKSKSCGVLRANTNSDDLMLENHTFTTMQEIVLETVSFSGNPLNLLLEAPLSVAFTKEGNPTHRKTDRRGPNERRDWYSGPGAAVLLSATYLLRAMSHTNLYRDVRLFEGFKSFKRTPSSHLSDAKALWQIVRHRDRSAITAPNDLQATASDTIVSAFAVAGMDFGIPPVIMA